MCNTDVLVDNQWERIEGMISAAVSSAVVYLLFISLGIYGIVDSVQLAVLFLMRMSQLDIDGENDEIY